MTNSPKVKVFVAIPTMGTVSDSQTFALRGLQEAYGDRVELVYPKQCVRRMFHDYARNSLVEEFLATDCEILWFLDSDITPPKNVLDLITVHDATPGTAWEAAGAPYPVFMTPAGSNIPQVVYTVYKNMGEASMAAADVPRSGTEFVDGIATGCLFLKRSVFDKLKKPYFEFKYDAETRSINEGEDLGFCKKLSEIGIKFFIDYSMVCRHQKSVCLLDVNNYATEFANKAVLAYDRDIREKMQFALRAAYERGRKDANGLVIPKNPIILA